MTRSLLAPSTALQDVEKTRRLLFRIPPPDGVEDDPVWAFLTDDASTEVVERLWEEQLKRAAYKISKSGPGVVYPTVVLIHPETLAVRDAALPSTIAARPDLTFGGLVYFIRHPEEEWRGFLYLRMKPSEAERLQLTGIPEAGGRADFLWSDSPYRYFRPPSFGRPPLCPPYPDFEVGP